MATGSLCCIGPTEKRRPRSQETAALKASKSREPVNVRVKSVLMMLPSRDGELGAGLPLGEVALAARRRGDVRLRTLKGLFGQPMVPAALGHMAVRLDPEFEPRKIRGVPLRAQRDGFEPLRVGHVFPDHQR